MVTAQVLRDAEREVVLTVRVTEGQGETTHEVTLQKADFARLAKHGEQPAKFVERCFAFLLERESKESILRTFDVSVIGRYFPEFEKSMEFARSELRDPPSGRKGVIGT